MHVVRTVFRSWSCRALFDKNERRGYRGLLRSTSISSDAFYLQEYVFLKALGEMACTKANCDKLLTCAIAPHQVYGPRDNLFLPNVLEAAGSGKLRIFAKSST